MNSIPINIPLTDSFSLKLHFNDCNILDSRLTSATSYVYHDTGYISDDIMPPKPIIISSNGITIRISLFEMPIFNNETKEKIQTKFIVLTVSSKLLKTNYFDGINVNNIEVLYNEFINLKIFFCSLDTFLNGYISDIDICFNRFSNSQFVFIDALTQLQNSTEIKQKFTRLINEPTNKGLSFSTRQSATPSLPFIKIYHKELELLHKSYEFYSNYLSDYQFSINNLTRFEATIKNYKHKERLVKYNIFPNNFQSLKQYLDIPQINLYNFIIFSLNSYIKLPIVRKKPISLNPTDHIIFEFIQNQIIKGFTLEQLLSVSLTFKSENQATQSVQRSRIRQKIKKIYQYILYLEPIKIHQNNHNQFVSEYLQLNGLNISNFLTS